MNNEELIKKITGKKEFSKLPKKDVEKIFNLFDKENYSELEKIKLTRDLLRKVYSAFTSGKLLNLKDKDPEWILKKHISTKERLPYYEELYSRLIDKEKVVFDLGAGINGFSFNFLPKGVEYVGIEAMGQLVDLMNYYFKTNNLEARAIHESLFSFEKIKKYLKQAKKRKIIFLFKTLDSLEMVERNYSKKLLKEIVPFAEKIVVSFATKSLVSRKSFRVKRYWFENFVKENFEVLDDFELGNERYIVFKNKGCNIGTFK